MTRSQSRVPIRHPAAVDARERRPRHLRRRSAPILAFAGSGRVADVRTREEQVPRWQADRSVRRRDDRRRRRGGLHRGLVSKGDVVIGGEVHGAVETAARLHVKSTGVIDGTVTAVDAKIEGTVEGPVVVTGKLEIGCTARVFGEVRAGAAGDRRGFARAREPSHREPRAPLRRVARARAGRSNDRCDQRARATVRAVGTGRAEPGEDAEPRRPGDGRAGRDRRRRLRLAQREAWQRRQSLPRGCAFVCGTAPSGP